MRTSLHICPSIIGTQVVLAGLTKRLESVGWLSRPWFIILASRHRIRGDAGEPHGCWEYHQGTRIGRVLGGLIFLDWWDGVNLGDFGWFDIEGQHARNNIVRFGGRRRGYVRGDSIAEPGWCYTSDCYKANSDSIIEQNRVHLARSSCSPSTTTTQVIFDGSQGDWLGETLGQVWRWCKKICPLSKMLRESFWVQWQRRDWTSTH